MTRRNNQVTTTLSDEEQAALTKLCMAQGLSEEALLRMAFRTYHDQSMKLHEGLEQRWFDKDGKQVWPLNFAKKFTPPET